MCVHIRRSDRVTSPWDANRKTITIPALLDDEHAVRAVREVLTALAVPQPTSGAICWCGAPAKVGPPRVPAQRYHSEVMARGA